MSLPVDTTEMPPPQKVESIKSEIARLEAELERVQLVVNQLEARLNALKQWIAPVKKLPFDVLSQIFVICAKQADLAPVPITMVCRWWREAILATPVAWSFINIYKRYPLEYLHMFLERSAPCLLHIGLRQSYTIVNDDTYDDIGLSDEVTVVLNYAHRLLCLSTRRIDELPERSFPNLRRLANCDPVNLRELDRSRFPSLRTLRLDCGAYFPTNGPFAFDGLPASLVDLKIPLTGAPEMALIRANAPTLQALFICTSQSHRNRNAQLTGEECVSMPSLQLLEVERAPAWPLRLLAPRLVSYDTITPNDRTILIRRENILHLSCIDMKTTNDYPALRSLRLWGSEALESIQRLVDELAAHAALLPHLEVIEFPTWGEPPVLHGVHESLMRRRELTGSGIELKCMDSGVPGNIPPMVGSINDLPCDTPESLPCDLYGERPE